MTGSGHAWCTNCGVGSGHARTSGIHLQSDESSHGFSSIATRSLLSLGRSYQRRWKTYTNPALVRLCHSQRVDKIFLLNFKGVSAVTAEGLGLLRCQEIDREDSRSIARPLRVSFAVSANLLSRYSMPQQRFSHPLQSISLISFSLQNFSNTPYTHSLRYEITAAILRPSSPALMRTSLSSDVPFTPSNAVDGGYVMGGARFTYT